MRMRRRKPGQAWRAPGARRGAPIRPRAPRPAAPAARRAARSPAPTAPPPRARWPAAAPACAERARAPRSARVTTSRNAATPTSVPCWITSSSASPLSSACTTVSRCRGSLVAGPSLLDDAVAALEPAERLGAVAGQQDEPVAVAQAEHARAPGARSLPAAGSVRQPSRRVRRRSGGASSARLERQRHPLVRRRGASTTARPAALIAPVDLAGARLDDAARRRAVRSARGGAASRGASSTRTAATRLASDERVALRGLHRERSLAAHRRDRRGRCARRSRAWPSPPAGRCRGRSAWRLAPRRSAARARIAGAAADVEHPRPASAPAPGAARGSRGWSGAARSRTPCPGRG